MSAPADSKHRCVLPLLFLSLFSACFDTSSTSGAGGAHGEGVDNGHDHGDEELAFVVTEWAKGYELFIEYPPPVADFPFQLIVHVSRLEDGTAREEGPILLHWTSPAGVERTDRVTAPARQGVYLPMVTLDAAGTWQLSIEIPGDTGATLIPLPDVEVFNGEHDAEHAQVPAELEGVAFLKEQQWLLGAATELVELRALQQRIVVPGRVQASPARQAFVTPPLAGRLEAPPSGALPGLGEKVEAGQLVGFVRPPWSDLVLKIQEARAAEREAAVELEREEREFERVKALHERDARSDRERQEARYDFELARAKHESARGGLEAIGALAQSVGDGEGGLPRFELRSPIHGIVQEVSATLGEAVEPGREMLYVLDASVVQIVAYPTPEQLSEIEPSLPPRCTRHGGAGGETVVGPLDMRLVFVADKITEPGHTVPVVYEAGNAGGELLVGELLGVGLATDVEREVISVPISALVDDAGVPTAYVQIGGETFEKRYLQLGVRSGGRVEILSGLELGERVVTQRAYAIRLAGASGSAPVHSH